MKKHILTFFLGLFICISSISAQDGVSKNALSYSVIRLDYFGPFEKDFSIGTENLSTGAMFSYHRNLLSNYLNIEVPLKIGSVKLFDEDSTAARQETLFGLDALLQFQYNTGSNLLVPYLSTGMGVVFLGDKTSDFQIPAGLGLDIKITEGIYFRARTEYRFSFSENRNNWNHILGVKTLLGTKKKKETTITITPTDRDGDGVPDAEDECPDTPGPAKYAGCPDRDGDGLIDKNDKCPDTPGPASNAGCPELEPEEKEVLAFASRNIQFNTGSAVIKEASFEVLNQVAGILNKYPEYKCSITGHTDSQGNEAGNLILSKNRAKACLDYLISKGIPRDRLSYDGFGETQPIADNAFEEGRAQNRRVLFEIFL